MPNSIRVSQVSSICDNTAQLGTYLNKQEPVAVARRVGAVPKHTYEIRVGEVAANRNLLDEIRSDGAQTLPEGLLGPVALP